MTDDPTQPTDTPQPTQKQRRVLVTGAAGRLGSAVADRLRAAGYDVSGTDIVHPSDTPAYPFEVADLLDHTVPQRLLEGTDAVAHIGNHPGIFGRSPQETFNENVAMNQNVFQAAAEQGVRHIVFSSTLQLIGTHVDTATVTEPPPPPDYPMTGQTPATPANTYALSKTVSELMLRYYTERCGLHTVALRLPWLHENQPHVLRATGEENEIDIVEGFTGLTYGDAADLFAAVFDAELTGHHVFMAGTTHRHRDLNFEQLRDAFYPGLPTEVTDLIDLTEVTEATGWAPTTTGRLPADRPPGSHPS